jgi:putative peptidoglycan lipid II flippase
VLLSALGTAGLVALAVPLATLLALLMPGADPASADRLAAGIAGFAPGLLGYGLFAVLSRALYARGDTGAAALAAVLGWAGVAGAAVGLAAVLPEQQRVLALTVANTLGMTVLGAALLVAVARRAGRPALAGVARTAVVAVTAAGLAAGAGWAVAGWLVPAAHPPAGGAVAGSGMLAGVVVMAVFGTVSWALDRRDVRPMTAAGWRRLRGVARRGRPASIGDEDRVR